MYSGVFVDRYYGAAGTSQVQTIDINTTNTTTSRIRLTNYNTQSISNFSFLDTALPPGMTITGINSNSC